MYGRPSTSATRASPSPGMFRRRNVSKMADTLAPNGCPVAGSRPAASTLTSSASWTRARSTSSSRRSRSTRRCSSSAAAPASANSSTTHPRIRIRAEARWRRRPRRALPVSASAVGTVIAGSVVLVAAIVAGTVVVEDRGPWRRWWRRPGARRAGRRRGCRRGNGAARPGRRRASGRGRYDRRRRHDLRAGSPKGRGGRGGRRRGRGRTVETDDRHGLRAVAPRSPAHLEEDERAQHEHRERGQNPSHLPSVRGVDEAHMRAA